MTSIKLFITLSIIAIITLVNFVSSLRGYRESMAEAEALFNDQLRQTALLVSAALPESNLQAQASLQQDHNFDELPGAHPGVLQVFTTEGRALLRVNTSALEPLVPLEPGYSDVNFEGYRWHALAYLDADHGRWIVTAQRDDIRYIVAERVVLESVFPTLLGIPVAGLLVWVLIGWGLRPISRLAGALGTRQATDLSALEDDALPTELTPLRDSINSLLERLRASFDRERRFTADAAHELRTPISVLKVQVHNLLEEMESPSANMQQLQKGVDRMGHLVEQILDLNRTAPDNFAPQLEPLDLHELCKSVISEVYPAINAKSQQVELQGECAMVRGDQFALEILLKNLLQNASKYTPEGSTIEVSVKQGNKVQLVVLDNGPGIPAEERDKALERFYRVGGDRHATSESGCGLGLAIVSHIVELHRGTIRLAEPDTGTGLKVQIEFPIVDDADEVG